MTMMIIILNYLFATRLQKKNNNNNRTVNKKIQ